MNFFNKSITRKLLLSILLPAFIMFLFLTLLVLSTVKESVNTQSDEIIKDGSIASSSEIDNFFIEFLSIVDVSAVNGNVINYLDNTKPGMRLNEMPEYALIMNELNKVAGLDKENIMAAWIGDTDSSQVMIGDGFITDTDYDITKREWYMQAIEGDKAIIAEPYIDANTEEMVVSIVAPVFKDGTLLGVFGVDLSLTHLYDVMSSTKLGETGYYTFLTKEGTIIYNPNKDYILKNISELPVSDNAKDRIATNEQGNITYELGSNSIHGYVNEIGDTSWKSISSLPDQEYNEIYNHLTVCQVKCDTSCKNI
ncbi:MAG: hypothetical protein EOM05_10090 [Clostridia bacterium]|nr:hypothetical protein [Clostridia bacterium]